MTKSNSRATLPARATLAWVLPTYMVTLDGKFKYNEFTWRVLMKYNTCIHFEPRGGYPSQMRFHLSRHETRKTPPEPRCVA